MDEELYKQINAFNNEISMLASKLSALAEKLKEDDSVRLSSRLAVNSLANEIRNKSDSLRFNMNQMMRPVVPESENVDKPDGILRSNSDNFNGRNRWDVY